MRVALLFPILSFACVPYEEEVRVSSASPPLQVLVQTSEPDYTSLFHDAGPVADPTPIADPTPKGITVEETSEPAPRAQVFIGGGGVTMNNVTINGDVYIGSGAKIVPSPPPSGATIQACEDYVDRVETCSVRMLGSREAAKRMIDSMEAARRTWRRFADDPRVRDSLADSCTVARRQYDSASASYCRDG
jgi:hypothetical protein